MNTRLDDLDGNGRRKETHMKKLTHFILLLLFSILISGCTQEKPNLEPKQTNTPLLIEATKEDTDKKIYLFGSIHEADETLYPLPDYVLDAYEKSDAIAVELDIVEAESDYASLLNSFVKFIYTDQKTIKEDISEETYEKGKEILEEAGLYNFMMDSFKPVIWYMMISNAASQDIDIDLDGEWGIDNYFLKEAKEDDKKIIELESADIQYEILENFTKDLQIYLLEQTIDSYEDSKEELKELYKAYKKGNIESLEELLFEEVEDSNEEKYIEEFNQKMITDRNKNMTASLEKALKEHDTIFCTVGLAHVIGEGGIKDLLSSKGYTVRIVN